MLLFTLLLGSYQVVARKPIKFMKPMVAASDSDNWSDNGRCRHLPLQSESEDEHSALLKRFVTAVTWSKQRSQNAVHSRPAKRRRVSDIRELIYSYREFSYYFNKVASPSCGVCELTLSRPCICLQCSFSACWQNGHMKQHLSHSGHSFCT